MHKASITQFGNGCGNDQNSDAYDNDDNCICAKAYANNVFVAATTLMMVKIMILHDHRLSCYSYRISIWAQRSDIFVHNQRDTLMHVIHVA